MKILGISCGDRQSRSLVPLAHEMAKILGISGMFRLNARHGPRNRTIGLLTEGLQVRVLPEEPDHPTTNSLFFPLTA
jgi:hypothetical protein